jgi:acetyl esterase/lipase
MAKDLNPIHPELRPIFKSFPSFTANRWTLPISRLLMSLIPGQKPPSDIKVDQIHIPDKEGKHQIPIRMYKPDPVSTNVPALVWLHGGGFVFGNAVMDDTSLFGLVRELGIVVISVSYRLAPENPFPVPLEDCYTALKWIHDCAGDLRIDPARIAVGGASAGGGLAATLAQLAHDRGEIPVAFQLLVYPMLDDRTVLRTEVPYPSLLTWTFESNRFGWESYLHQKCGSDKLPPYAAASRRDDLTGLPPAWIGVGTIDLFSEEDRAYAERLKQCGVSCEWVPVSGAFHGFDAMTPKLPITRDFRRSQMEALRKHLFST